MNSEQNTPSQRPSLANNWLSLFGFWLALAFLTGQALLIVADLVYGHDNPYVGILIYIVGPTILTIGLLLVPLGMWREHRRRLRTGHVQGLPILDLNHPRHQRYIGIFTVMTVIFLSLTSVGTYQAYHVTESNEFCGVLCHQVMVPQYTAYQNSPHSRVDCVSCHIGPGATWFAKSKLSGAWQIYAVLTDSYHLPIESPIDNLRPATDTCEQCHWPEKFYPAVERSLTYYGSDPENTPYRIDLRLNVGGSSPEIGVFTGIHWHIALDHTLEYYAMDRERQVIPWIRVTYDDGRVYEYIDETIPNFDPENIPADQIRRMDCIDCHNRPTHRFYRPSIELNRAMDLGLVDPRIPNVKAIVSRALETPYESTPQAEQAIEAAIRTFYEDFAGESEENQQKIDQVVGQALRIYSRNVFPEYSVDWTTHQWNTSHFQSAGCYRCHNDRHQTIDGLKISNDCNLCHTIVRQGEGWDEIEAMIYQEQEFIHPRGLHGLWEGQNCHECHGA